MLLPARVLQRKKGTEKGHAHPRSHFPEFRLKQPQKHRLGKMLINLNPHSWIYPPPPVALYRSLLPSGHGAAACGGRQERVRNVPAMRNLATMRDLGWMLFRVEQTIGAVNA